MNNTQTGIDIDDLSLKVMDEPTIHYNFYADDRAHSDWIVALDRTDEEMDQGDWEPMMNTLWPLPDDFSIPANVRERLDNMTIVEVERDDGWAFYLALTGGGMDMSWPIARTYVKLGLCPPVALGRLPNMADVDYRAPINEAAIRALRRSHATYRKRLNGYINDLDGLLYEQEE